MTDYKVEAAWGSAPTSFHRRDNLAAGVNFANVVGTTIATNVSAAGKTWTRITCAENAGVNGARLNVSLGSLVNGSTYAVAHLVYNDGAAPVTIVMDWCDTPGSTYTVQPGQTVRVSTSGARATYDATYRFTDIMFPAGQNGLSILVAQTVVELNSAGPYFSGSSEFLPGPADSGWTDISDSVTGLKIRRGRNNEFDEIETGTLSVELDNADGRFTPLRQPTVLDTNLVTNPGFRAASGSNLYRTNVATNPGCEAASVNWLSNNGTYWTNSLDTTVKRSGTQSIKSTPQAAAVGTTRTLLSMYNVGGGVFAAAAGDVVTASVYVAHNAAVPGEANLTLTWLDSGSAVIGSVLQGAFVTGIAGDSTFTARPTITATAPANTATVRIGLNVNRQNGQAFIVAGEFAWADECLIEKAGLVLPYFDGSTVPTSTQTSEGFTIGWASTANASASNLYGPSQVSIGPFSAYTANTASARVFTAGEYRQRYFARTGLNSGAIAVFSGGSDALTYHARAVPGDVNRGRVQVRMATGATAIGLLPRLGWYNAAGSIVGNVAGPVVTVPSDGSWVDIVVPGTGAAPAATTSIRWLLYAQGAIPAGTELEFRNALVDVGWDTPPPYFDGGAGYAFTAWSGTADASTSLQYGVNYYPNIVPGVPIRVRASTDGFVTYNHVAVGYAEKWPVKLDDLATVELSCTDGFSVFAATTLREPIVERNAGKPQVYLPLSTQDYGYTNLGKGGAKVTAYDAALGGASISWEQNSEYPSTRLGDGTTGGGWTLTTPVSSQGTVLRVPFTITPNTLDSGTYYGGCGLSFWWTPDARADVTNATTQQLISGLTATGVAGAVGYSFNGGSTVYAVEGQPVFIEMVQQALNANSLSTRWYASSALTGWLPVQVGYSATGGPYVNPNVGNFMFGGALDETNTVVTNAASGTFRHLIAYDGGGLTPSLPSGSRDPGQGVNETDQLTDVCNWSKWPSLVVKFDATRSVRLGLDFAAGETALTVLKDAADDAGGLVYMAPSGMLRYRNRHSRPGSVASVSFTNANATNPQPGLTAYVDTSHLVNDVTVKYPGITVGDSYRAQDTNSIARYGRVAPSDVDTLVMNPLERQDKANNVLAMADSPMLRIEGVSFDLTTFPDPVSLLTLDIGDRIYIEFPSPAPYTSGEYFIEGVEVDVSAEGTVAEGSIAFDISPATAFERWVLGNSTNGALDSAVLGY